MVKKESVLVKFIKRHAEKRGHYFKKNVPIPKGFPDITYIIVGVHFYIETKREENGKIGLEQARQHKKLRDAGCKTAFIKTKEEFLNFIGEAKQ